MACRFEPLPEINTASRARGSAAWSFLKTTPFSPETSSPITQVVSGDCFLEGVQRFWRDDRHHANAHVKDPVHFGRVDLAALLDERVIGAEQASCPDG